jgi:hypothetical protein
MEPLSIDDFAESREPRISKRFMEHWTEEAPCAFCGCPMYYPEDRLYFELEHLEHLVFCSRGCAADYWHNSEY